MASKQLLPIFAAFLLLLPAFSLAKEFIVGDDKGWTMNFDYQTWAQGKDFRVGDKLVFNYPKGVHNVFRVDGTTFQSCVAPNEGALESGNDVITLVTPGKKWYICGVGKHCEVGGQKLTITVNQGSASKIGDAGPSPAPSGPQTPNSAPGRIASPSSQVVAMVVILAISLAAFMIT